MKEKYIYILPLFFIILGFFLENSLIYSAFIIYALDAGHVYSTLLESHLDLNHERKVEIYFYTILSFLLNLVILYYWNSYFFTYIFYFTIFHNMRQGFGFVLMERGIISSWVIKTCYYVGTMIPFLLFHMREINSKMTSDILNNVDLFYINDYISYNKLCFLYYSLILGFLIFGILKKEYKRLMPFMWFSMLYWYSFVISESQMISYWVLVISHAIPYFWILKNRIIKTHNSSIIKRYADYLLVGLFILGGYLDYLHDGKSIGSNIWFESVFFTPLITHFFIDGILWKKSDPRFKKLMEKNDKTI